jgi:hypothetical protein
MQAQVDIGISISKELKEGNQYVKVLIKNYTNSQKILFAMASWGGNEGDYILEPLSYIRLIGNPGIQGTKETSKLIISNEIDKLNPTKSKTYIKLDANASYYVYYKLYGEDYGPFRAFNDSDKLILKYLQASVVLNYFDTSDEKPHKLEVKTNIIIL